MPALRVHRADQEPASCTLREAFERHLLPDLIDASKATIRQYYTALGHWETFVSGGKLGKRQGRRQVSTENSTSTATTRAVCDRPEGLTDDPSAVTDAVARAFRDFLRSGEFSPGTVNTVWNRLRAIFRRLAPRYPGNPQGLGLIDQVPYMQPLAASRPRKRIIELAELDAVYEACQIARWPTRGTVHAVWVWQALLVLLTNHGPRTQDAVRLDWDSVCWEAHSPDAESLAAHAAGWLVYTPVKTRRHKPEPLLLPMHPTTRAHLARLRSLRDRVFPFSGANHSFYEQWGAILEAAKVRPFDLKDLRKTCNTAYNRIKPGLGKWVLGHAPRGVNETFYLGAIERELIDAVGQLPQPPTFMRLLDEPSARQQLLF